MMYSLCIRVGLPPRPHCASPSRHKWSSLRKLHDDPGLPKADVLAFDCPASSLYWLEDAIAIFRFLWARTPAQPHKVGASPAICASLSRLECAFISSGQLHTSHQRPSPIFIPCLCPAACEGVFNTSQRISPTISEERQSTYKVSETDNYRLGNFYIRI